MPMEAIGSPSKYCFTLLSFTVLIYYPSLISCTHEFWKISTVEGRPNEKGQQIWDSKIRWQKKFETPRRKNHLKTRLWDPSKTFPRFQDLAKIFLDLCFSSYHSLPLFSPQKPLEKFTDKHATHISAQKICSTNKYRIQGHNNFKVLNRSGLEAC